LRSSKISFLYGQEEFTILFVLKSVSFLVTVYSVNTDTAHNEIRSVRHDLTELVCMNICLAYVITAPSLSLCNTEHFMMSSHYKATYVHVLPKLFEYNTVLPYLDLHYF
jgi:hypothetical protein